MDKALAMLILATTAASMNMEVEVFFTFWGLNFLKKGKSYKNKNIFQKMMEMMMPSGKNKLPLSTLNMMGVGTAMMKQLMTSKRMASIDELFELARQFKVKLVACSTSCGIMGVDPSNMIEGVEVAGATTFLAEAKNSKINLFI